MKNSLILTLLCALFCTSGVLAQTTRHDSIIKMAQKDAQKLRLSKTSRMRFNKDKNNYMSDLFKPTRLLVSDIGLLNDSLYVKAFRLTAYKKAYHKHTIGQDVLDEYYLH